MSGKSPVPEVEPVETTAAKRDLPWAAIAWFSALLIVAYFPILKHLVEQWSDDPDVGHGFFVPIVAGYIAWGRRDALMALDWKPAWWGLALMGYGFVQAYIGMLGAELFLQRS